MGFPERALQVCQTAMTMKCLSERHVRDVLKCDKIDVSSIEPFLKDESESIRIAAVRIVGTKGNVGAVVQAALKEHNRGVLSWMLRVIGERGEGCEALYEVLFSGDTIIRDEMIEMLRKAKQSGLLFPLLFSEDPVLAERIKRYIDEAGT